MPARLRVLDLFAGIGGLSLGLERTGGFKTVAFCEIDPFCRRVLAKHWPDVPCAEDITTREFREGEADVVTGGFPCQDISFAGDGAGLAGARSGLWRELLRAIRLVRPRYALVENVAALLTRGMGTVLGDLAEIGLDAEWHCIPASAVGAPHRRDRVWIVANPGGEQHEGDSPPLSGSFAAQLAAADTDNQRELQSQGCEQDEWRRTGDGCQQMADAERGGCEVRYGAPELSTLQRGWWSIEPNVGRVAHGIPARVDRLRSLGNAVVPQIPELLGRAILEVR